MIPNLKWSNSEFQSLLEKLVRVGEDLLIKQKDAQVLEMKSNNTPLSSADQQADQDIRLILKEFALTLPILSEEGDLPDYEVRKNWETFWLVDPLDGTKEYLAGLPEFTVNVALISDGEPIVGIVYSPGTNELYWAQKNQGAFLRHNGKTEQIFSMTPAKRGDRVSILESRSHPSEETQSYLQRFEVTKRTALGSSLKICRVAKGDAQLYPRLGPTMEWDTAAADAIYRNSGKNSLRFSPLIYNKTNLKNPYFALGATAEEQP